MIRRIPVGECCFSIALFLIATKAHADYEAGFLFLNHPQNPLNLVGIAALIQGIRP